MSMGQAGGKEGNAVFVRRTLVLVSGKARRGKDTFVEGLREYAALARRDGKTFERRSFAEALKRTALDMGWNGEKDEAGRRFLQELGTTLRNYNKDGWVLKMLSGIEKAGYPPLVAVSDCRYPNEIDVVRSWGVCNGYDVQTVRIEGPERGGELSPEARAHPSETSLDGRTFDLVLENDAPDADAFRRSSFAAWASRFPESYESLGGKWASGAECAPLVDGTSATDLRALSVLEDGKPFFAVDFDDTLLEKTGSVDRTPVFKALSKAGYSMVVVTSRREGLADVQSFLDANGMSAAAVVYGSGTKELALEILRPVCMFDDDPRVAEKAAATGTPLFSMGEFSCDRYVGKWVDAVRKAGEEEFYVSHAGGLSLEEICLGRRPSMLLRDRREAEAEEVVDALGL